MVAVENRASGYRLADIRIRVQVGRHRHWGTGRWTSASGYRWADVNIRIQ